MSLRDLEQRCELRLRELSLPDPFDLAVFCSRIAAGRGRPLRLMPFTQTRPEAPCGMWVPTPTADYVYYEEATSPLHREHNVLHELGHMIFDHPASPELLALYRDQLLPGLNPEVVTRVLGRTSYSTEQEREAEMLATLIGSRARREYVPDARLPPGMASALSRARDTLGPRA